MEGQSLENLEKESSWGGAREGSGRPAGSINKATKEKKLVEEEIKQRVLRSADELINAQMNLAQGVQMLYRITTNEKGVRSKPELITDQPTIEAYLAGELEDEDKEYYFITTERPDNRALDSLFDRTFGRAKQNVSLDGGEDENGNLMPVLVKFIDAKPEDNRDTEGVSATV